MGKLVQFIFRGDEIVAEKTEGTPVRYMDPSGHWCDDMERVYQELKEQAIKNGETITPET